MLTEKINIQTIVPEILNLINLFNDRSLLNRNV